MPGEASIFEFRAGSGPSAIFKCLAQFRLKKSLYHTF